MKIGVANSEPPDQGNYDYTIAAPVAGEGRYVNSRDQKYGHIRLVIAPNEGEDNQFEWKASTEDLPYPFMKDACRAGMDAVLQKHPKRLVRIRIAVVDGSYHDQDTDAMAVRVAMMMAMHDALSGAEIVRA